MKVITKKDLNKFREEFDKAMEDLCEKTGFEIKLGSISYDETTFTAKLTAAVNDEEAKIESFLRSAKLLGFDDISEKDYKRIFTAHDGKQMQLVEINIQRPKNCMGYIELGSGRAMKSGIEYYRTCIKKKK